MYNHQLFDSLSEEKQHDIFEKINHQYDIDCELIRAFRNKELFPGCPKLSFGTIQAIWRYYAGFNCLREQHERYLFDLRDQTSYIISFMYRITELCGHTRWDPEKEFIEEHRIRKTTFYKLVDWIDGFYTSDYGFPKLKVLQCELYASDDPVHILITIDRILNVWHGRGPLADRFIEGGLKSLNQLAFSTEPT